MANNEKISIIIPVYNVSQYVNKTIESVCNQSYDNLEIILVNDGSTDSSIEICEYFFQKDSRIVLINQKNQGLSGARNTGISHATGDYIGFVDGDDWIENDMYEILLNKSLEYNADIAVCNYKIIDKYSQIKKINDSFMKNSTYFFSETIKALNFIIYSNNIVVWNKLYKRYLFNEIKFPFGYTYEDVCTTHYLVENAHRVIILNDIKYNYVYRAESITNQSCKKQRKDIFTAYLQRYLYLSKKYPRLEKVCRQYIFIALISIMKSSYKENIYLCQDEMLTYLDIVMKYDANSCGLPEGYKKIYKLIIDDMTFKTYLLFMKMKERM
jgi:glycosyltransferase involved in cell wall biosynthesis